MQRMDGLWWDWTSDPTGADSFLTRICTGPYAESANGQLVHEVAERKHDVDGDVDGL
jgi:hypothetical protein